MDAQKRASEALTTINESLADLQRELTLRCEKITKLDEDTVKAEEKLVKVNEQIDQRKAAFLATKKEKETEIDNLSVKIASLTSEITQATKELESVKKKHSQFVTYQIKADKALKAREQAVLETEEALKGQADLMRRRGSILESF